LLLLLVLLLGLSHLWVLHQERQWLLWLLVL
jgi:hypothetical protein